MFVTAATVPGDNDAPNEDWVGATNDLIVVLDGGTVRTDTGCRHGVAWYTSRLGPALLAAASDQTRTLQDAIADAIRVVADAHSLCDLTHPGTPSAACAVVRREGDMLRYAVLGDVTIVADTADQLVVVTDDRIGRSAQTERRTADRYLIGSPEKDVALEAMKHRELAARNLPGGYWIAAADPTVASYAVAGEMHMASVRRLAVLTDGAGRWAAMFRRASWAAALDVLERQGPLRFIRDVREYEARDPRGERCPRNKATDDATVVFAVVSPDVEPAPDRFRDETAAERAVRLASLETTSSRIANSGGLMGSAPRFPGWESRRLPLGAPCTHLS